MFLNLSTYLILPTLLVFCSFITLLALSNPKFPSSILRKVAPQTDWQYRLCVAKCQNVRACAEYTFDWLHRSCSSLQQKRFNVDIKCWSYIFIDIRVTIFKYCIKPWERKSCRFWRYFETFKGVSFNCVNLGTHNVIDLYCQVPECWSCGTLDPCLFLSCYTWMTIMSHFLDCCNMRPC
jgi:hypothetical protein